MPHSTFRVHKNAIDLHSFLTSLALRQLAQMAKEPHVLKRRTAERAKVALVKQHHTKRHTQLGRADASAKHQRIDAHRHLRDARDAGAAQHMAGKLGREQQVQLRLDLGDDAVNGHRLGARRALRQRLSERLALKHVDVRLRVARCRWRRRRAA
jgi:hypothetical protein